LNEDLKKRELELTKSRLQSEKLRNEIDTLKMFEGNFDEVSSDNTNLNYRLQSSLAKTEKDTLFLQEFKTKLQTADSECKRMRVQNDDLNHALDIHDEQKL